MPHYFNHTSSFSLITIGVFLKMDMAGQLYAQLEPILGISVVNALNSVIENAANSNSSTFATIVSLAVSVFGATAILRKYKARSIQYGELKQSRRKVG